MNKLEIKNVVFCESIRPEINGKYTLLGAAAPELNITLLPNLVLPAVIPVALFITGVPSSVGAFAVEIRALDVDGKQLIGGKLDGEFNGAAITSIVLGTMPLQVEKEGDYVFEWNFGGDIWEGIETIRVNFLRPEVSIPVPTV